MLKTPKMDSNKLKVTILASGSGSNAENIVNYAKNGDSSYSVCSIMCNKKDAYVLKRAEYLNVPSITFSSSDLKNNVLIYNDKKGSFTDYLKENNIGLIILAGFLLKIPDYLLKIYNGRILNIHPALLPKYGGKGMYGEHVHQAVIEHKEKISGITIHVIDNDYDRGHTIHQSTCLVTEDDTPETLAAKIHELERIYPSVIDKYVRSLENI